LKILETYESTASNPLNILAKTLKSIHLLKILFFLQIVRLMKILRATFIILKYPTLRI